MHFMARPLGMMQGRGAMLAFWDDVLPRVDADLLAAHVARSPPRWPRAAAPRSCEQPG
jgi:hypothetical protein